MPKRTDLIVLSVQQQKLRMVVEIRFVAVYACPDFTFLLKGNVTHYLVKTITPRFFSWNDMLFFFLTL